jgi:O-antigen ligase
MSHTPSRRRLSSLAPKAELHRPWQLLQLALLLFPTLPVIGGLILGGLTIFLWARYYRELWKQSFNGIFAVIFGLMILSSAAAYKPGEAFLGLANIVPGFLGFAPFVFLLQTPLQLRRLAWLSVIGSIPVLGLGIGQIVAAWTTPTWMAAIFAWVLEANGNPAGRMASVFMYANILAGYLVIILALSLGLAVEAYQAYQRDRDSQALARFLVLLAFIATVGIALLLTSSRNAWAIAILTLLAYAIYLGWRSLVLLVTTFAAAVLWASFGTIGREGLRQIVPAMLWQRLSGEMYPNVPVEHLRITQWQFTLEMMQERPLLGWGLRNFSHLYEARWQIWLGHPHNLFLMLGSEMGLLATLLLCGLVGWTLAQAILLVYIWSKALRPQWYRDRSILFAWIVAFSSCVLFNCLDVSIFDLRLGCWGWILLYALWGVTSRYRKLLPLQGLSRVKPQSF